MVRLFRNKIFLVILAANILCLAFILPDLLSTTSKTKATAVASTNSKTDSISIAEKKQALRNDSITKIRKLDSIQKARIDSIKKKQEDSLYTRVMQMEANIISRARNYEQLVIVAKYMHPQSKNFPFVPAIIPLKPGTYKRISSHFGMRFHPIRKMNKMHFGMDISAEIGTTVFATADGIVKIATTGYPGYGTMVEIIHPLGFRTIYGHLKSFSVKTGQPVTRGVVIGTVGNSGLSTGPHLHYEIIKNNQRIDPIRFVNFAREVLLNGNSY
jgi:murein DD-endopeptidase MepM/ murein hydrolase activator NlpD